MASGGTYRRRVTVMAAPIKVEKDWKPPKFEKEASEAERIHDVIADNFLFKALEKDEFNTIIDAMQVKEFEPGDVLIRQGDAGDFFYVLDSGVCDVSVEGKGKVAEVCRGGYVGELALMYDAPRAATVVAREKVRAFALDQVTFKKTVMGATMAKRALHEEFISSIPLLESLSHYQKLTIADALVRAEFAEGSNIISEGEEGDRFYIIEEGEVKVTKRGEEGEVSRRLRRGDYFGERALILDDVRAATVTAVMPTCCQTLDRATFKRLIGPLEDLLREKMDKYADYKKDMDKATAAHAVIEEAPEYSDTESEDED